MSNGDKIGAFIRRAMWAFLFLIIVFVIIMIIFPDVYLAFVGGATAFFATLFGINIAKRKGW